MDSASEFRMESIVALLVAMFWKFSSVKFSGTSGSPYALTKPSRKIIISGTSTMTISVSTDKNSSGYLAPRSLISVGRMLLPLMMSYEPLLSTTFCRISAIATTKTSRMDSAAPWRMPSKLPPARSMQA